MNRVRALGWSAWSVACLTFAAAMQPSHALQPEPQMMFDLAAGPVAAMMGARGAPGPHAGAQRGVPLLPPVIQLTAEQQDRLFELRHAQEPALRARLKELHSAHASLRELALTEGYDEARARPIVARAALASSEVDLLHARLQHAAFLLLTPEQRKQLAECRPGAAGARKPPGGCLPPPR